jgi:LysM repeat protein
VVLVIALTGFTRQSSSLNFTAYDVIDAVNSLRSAKGLPVLKINGALMAAAQAHSEYQAASHQSSHSDASGSSATGRVAASGYSSGAEFLAGENVASLTIGTDNSVSIIMNEIWADAVHLGAMLNPKYTDIGVGVAVDDTMAYVTLNVAGLKNSTTPASGGQTVEAGQSPLPPVLARVTSTPLPDGTVIHVVGYGQTLGTIATMYGVSIQELVDRNHIDPDKIYAGQKLWIMRAVIPTVTPTTLPSLTASPTDTPLPEMSLSPTETITPTPAGVTSINTRELGIGLIFFALGGFLVYLIFQWSRLSKSVHS